MKDNIKGLVVEKTNEFPEGAFGDVEVNPDEVHALYPEKYPQYKLYFPNKLEAEWFRDGIFEKRWAFPKKSDFAK